MTLRWKVLFIIAATFAVLIAAVYLASRTILLDGILAMEQSLGRRDVERCTAFIRQELAHMDRLANDYASWNDTYEYVADPAGHREYIRANMIDTTFENLKLNLLIIVDREGRIVFGRGYDLREKREMPVPPAIGPHLREGTPLFLAGGALDGRFGVILLPAA
ncbi:MAG TPA: CHASE4 domain-containing protein, partial [bacterium]|nr:CHASE4 domain-containing protein [bacterium]